jgi:hypothetical protein
MAAITWGFLLADVYLRLPNSKKNLEAMGVQLPPVWQWTLDNASWVAPGIGLVTMLLVGTLRNRTARWVVATIVAVVCFLALLLLRVQAVFLVRPVDPP